MLFRSERLGRLSLAQFVAPRRTRAEITCLRVDLLALDLIQFKFSVSDLNLNSVRVI